MKKQTVAKRLHLVFSAALIALLAMSIAPAQTARAQEITSTSDLVVSVVSIPKHGKACETYEATYTVTNLGPDPATNVNVGFSIPDQLEYFDVQGEPTYLGVGETVTVTVVIEVLYVDEYRNGWVTAIVYSAPYPDISIDPNPENNRIETPFKIIGSNQNCR